MNSWQQMVTEFHEKFGQPVGDRPRLLTDDRFNVRDRWTMEEAEETLEAQNAKSLTMVADGIVDQLYFLIGTAVEMGIDLDPLFRAVHEANMRKTYGDPHSDGKIAKPAGWVAPDIFEELRKQGA